MTRSKDVSQWVDELDIEHLALAVARRRLGETGEGVVTVIPARVVELFSPAADGSAGGWVGSGYD